MESRGRAKTREKRELEMSPFDEFFGKTALDRMSSLVNIFVIGVVFGAGFWMVWRVVN